MEKKFPKPDVKTMKDNKKATLSEIIASEIANKHNQHRIMLVEGKTGTGKSNFCLRLSYDVSVHFSKMLGGEPEDYFSIPNVAMLTPKELVRVVKSIKPYGIYVMDDIGGDAFNSRNWNSKGNKIFGYILQTFRTYNNLLIMSAPDREFVDKIGRNILHYKVVMKENLELMNYGYSMGSVSRVQKMYQKDNGGNMYPFLTRDRKVFTSIKVKRAPVHLIEEYEVNRKRIQAETQAEKMKLFDELVSEFEETTTPKVSVKDRVQELRRDVQAGVYPSLKQACEDVGINYGYAKQIKGVF